LVADLQQDEAKREADVILRLRPLRHQPQAIL
jgi:hypothetical protein